MSAGRGWAKRLTPERLARYAPLFEHRAETGGQDAYEQDRDEANMNTPTDPAAALAEEDFRGESVQVNLPFRSAQRASRRAGAASRTLRPRRYTADRLA